MILILVDSSTLGGIERHIEALARALRSAGVGAEIALLTARPDNPWLAQLEQARIPYRMLDGSLAGLTTLLRGEQPALLHTHGYKSNVLGRLAARMAQVPVVSTYHAGERAPFPVNLYQLIDEWTSCLGHRIAVSQPIADSLPFATPVIANFLDTPAAPPAAPLPRRIGFVGRLSHEKAPDLFCRLASQYRSGEEWHVFGDGPMRAELEREFAGTVTFHGMVTDIDSVWPTLGLLVMPSRAEGLPMAALEALAAGVPILASRVGGLPDVVLPDRTGWLFEVGDLEAAARDLTRWRRLDAEGQRALRARCWAHVSDRYGARRQIEKVLAVYRKALGSGQLGAADQKHGPIVER